MSVRSEEAKSAQKRRSSSAGHHQALGSASSGSFGSTSGLRGAPPKSKRPPAAAGRRPRPPPKAVRGWYAVMKPSMALLPAVLLVAIGCVFIVQPSFIFGAKPAQETPPAGPTAGDSTSTVTPGSPTVTPTTDQEAAQGGSTTRPPVRNAKAAAVPKGPKLYTYKVVQTFPHDKAAFTQGLVYFGKTEDNKDILYESTGLYGQSTVRRTVLQNGKVLNSRKNDASTFGEGIAMVDGNLIQVTWKTQQMLKYSTPDLKPLAAGTHGMTDGWGLTTDSSGRLYGSDGTEFLYHLDPKTYAVTKKVKVLDGKRAIVYLNELESVGTAVWANVWQTPCLAKIDPNTGKVLAWVDMGELVGQVRANGGRVDVLNGIAWDSAGKRLFVTGKWWPNLYSIQLVPMQSTNYTTSLANTRKKCWPSGGLL